MSGVHGCPSACPVVAFPLNQALVATPVCALGCRPCTQALVSPYLCAGWGGGWGVGGGGWGAGCIAVPCARCRYTDLVAHHCSADALRLMMPALLPHEDLSKRHHPHTLQESLTSIVGVLPFMSRRQEPDREAEAKGAFAGCTATGRPDGLCARCEAHWAGRIEDALLVTLPAGLACCSFGLSFFAAFATPGPPHTLVHPHIPPPHPSPTSHPTPPAGFFPRAAQAGEVATRPLSVCLPVLRSYAQRVNDLAHFAVFVGEVGAAVHKVCAAERADPAGAHEYAAPHALLLPLRLWWCMGLGFHAALPVRLLAHPRGTGGPACSAAHVPPFSFVWFCSCSHQWMRSARPWTCLWRSSGWCSATPGTSARSSPPTLCLFSWRVRVLPPPVRSLHLRSVVEL